jgi:hypothetical protein
MLDFIKKQPLGWEPKKNLTSMARAKEIEIFFSCRQEKNISATEGRKNKYYPCLHSQGNKIFKDL